MSGALSQVFMTAKDTNQGYTTVLIPSIRYILPATSIKSSTLSKIQIPVINNVLTKLGYNRHMPRAVVFASTSIGGIGLLDLYTEQEGAKIINIISHIRAESHLSSTIIIALETYQTVAGIITSALEDTTEYNYITSAPWITSVRSFLHSINGKIYIPQLVTINKIRLNDQPIMNTHAIQPFTKSQLEAINACRLFLQVTTIAEISNDIGTHILLSAVKGTCNDQGSPLLHKYSTSKLHWPYQTRPPQKSWNLWKKFLKQLTTNTPTMRLLQPLGAWLPNCHEQRQWTYIQYGNDIVNTHTKPHKFYALTQ
jgi:hypothetical protein